MQSPDDDIDQLISELHASTAPSPPASGDTGRLEHWLRILVDAGGSDLLLVPGSPPCIRVEGQLRPLADGPLDGVDVEESILPALPPHARKAYRHGLIADGSFTVSALGRFRINLHRERGRAAAAVRALPTRVPRLATLNLPPTVEPLAQLPSGLVLLGGPTGSGKSTTLAALVDEINRRASRHVVTIEDPIEYEHAMGPSLSKNRWRSLSGTGWSTRRMHSRAPAMSKNWKSCCRPRPAASLVLCSGLLQAPDSSVNCLRAPG